MPRRKSDEPARHYTDKDKENAVRAYLRGDMTASAIRAKFGVTMFQLQAWFGQVAMATDCEEIREALIAILEWKDGDHGLSSVKHAAKKKGISGVSRSRDAGPHGDDEEDSADDLLERKIEAALERLLKKRGVR